MYTNCDFCNKKDSNYIKCGYLSKSYKGIVKVKLCAECVEKEKEHLAYYENEKGELKSL